MNLAQAISNLYGSNKFVIERNAEGLTQADSLLQPQPDGNCLNWVLGHVLASRNRALALLDETPIWDEARIARYSTNSQAVTPDSKDVAPLEKLLADLQHSQKRLEGALAQASDETLARSLGERTLGQQLLGLAWHETYHAGQTEYLRRLAGKLEGGVR